MKITARMALVLLAAWTGLAAAQKTLSPVDYFEMHARADALFAKQAYAEALPLYEQLVATNPEDGALHFNLALTYYYTGSSANAVPEITRALELGHGRESQTAFQVSKALAQGGQRDLAMQWARRALDARYTDRADFRTDSAFVSLWSDPEFMELVLLPPKGDLARDERWRFDLDYFLAEAKRLHASPDRQVMATEFAASVEALKGRVPELTNEEIEVELQKILVTLGDGHTSIRGHHNERFHRQFLPLEFYFFSDGLFIIDAADEYKNLIGKRVVSMGDRPTDAILNDLKSYVGRDNEQGLLWIGPYTLRNTSYLKDMGYTSQLSSASVTVSDADGSSQTREVVAAHWKHPGRLHAPVAAAATKPPLYLQHVDKNFWHTAIAGDDAYYVQLNAVQDAEDATIAKMIADAHGKLLTHGARNLVLDLRLNGGGNNNLMWPVVRLVAAHEMASPEHRTFVITGRNTFSACQNLINYLERMTNAMFAGEPSSSKVNFTGEGSYVTLPFSSLQMSISSRYWQDGIPEDSRQSIAMDVPVALSSSDYFANRDPVMEALKKIMGAAAAAAVDR